MTGAEGNDRGCRSQIRTRVANADTWLQNYTAGLHRVIFYGNYMSAAKRMGHLLGFQVIDEMAVS